MNKYLFIVDKKTWQMGNETTFFIQEFENDEAARTHAASIFDEEYGYSKKVVGLYLLESGKNLV